MAGIYIHIPFCKQACNYCNFHFSVNLEKNTSFIKTLLREIEIRKDYLQHEKVETIYFGGGTPSILSANEINEIHSLLSKAFEIAETPEITLEANPDDLTDDKLKELKQTPLNRLSIGVQSFFDEDLQYLNRVHNSKQAAVSIKQAQDAGFENITLDLIYAIPTLTDVKWAKNLQQIAKLSIPHFSAYCLTVEPRTALEKFIREKKLKDVDEAVAARQFEMLMDFAINAGYDHYEISNFSRPGYYSKHNSSYWNGKKYLGLGPSAHSYDGESRQWNISNNTLYIQSLEKGSPVFEAEHLTSKDHFNEYLLTSLRTASGADLNFIAKNFGAGRAASFQDSIAPLLQEKLAELEAGKIRLTRAGKLIADRIISDLFDTD